MLKKYTFVVVTPTYNRVELLPRLYDSLCKQVFKDFYWLIVNDGSNDGTEELVKRFINERKIEVRYVYKENGGKHTALLESFKHVSNSLYYYVIDSDDELVEQTLATFKHVWDTIEAQGKSSWIGLIKARTKVNGHEAVNVDLFKNHEYIDMCYQDFTIKHKNESEYTTCHRTAELYDYFNIPTSFLYDNKVNFFPEGVLWARAGRKTVTRYIPNVLRIVHLDADDSLCRVKKRKGDVDYLYRYIVGIKYYTCENFDYLFQYRKVKLIRDIIYYTAMCRIVGIHRKELFHNLELFSLKVLAGVLYPVSLLARIGFIIKYRL